MPPHAPPFAVRAAAALLACLLPPLTCALAAAPEPWGPLSGGSFSGPAVPLSPDPLVRYVYGASVNLTALQLFPVLPAATALAPGTLASSFDGWETLSSPAASVLVSGAGGLLVDFGVELPAWVELDSPDLSPQDLPLLTLGTSEFNEVEVINASPKQGTPKAYNGTYRLETNKELYEGVRYGFLTLSAAPSRPFTVTALRAVAQAKPVNYSGAFSADARLTAIWYTAAYTVRTNLEPQYMGAILEDRGDRYSWAGDAHTSQAASLAAFGNTWDVLQNLAGTARSQNGIASYSLYWCDSVMDYYAFARDGGVLAQYTDEVQRILAGALAAVNSTTAQTFVGWDDRLGSGFKDASTAESQWYYKLNLVRLLARWGESLTAAGNASAGAAYAAQAAGAWGAVRGALDAAAAASGAPWYAPLGVHAAAEALSTLRCTAAEAQALVAARFNDSTALCSLSNFNQYWILKGLASAGALDRGLALVEQCWWPTLAMGGTTFWEITSPDWAAFTPPGAAVPNGENGYTSLCHPWSAGPTAWLSAHALGVRLLPGGEAAAGAAARWGRALIAPHVSAAMLRAPGAGAAGGAVVLAGRVPCGSAAAAGGGCVVGVEVSAGAVRVTLPPGERATLLLSEALLRRLQGGGSGSSSSSSGSAAAAAPLPASLRLSSSSAGGDSAVQLRWAALGDASLPPTYAPPLLEAAGGAVAPGRAAAVLLEGGGAFTLHLPPPPPAAAAAAAAPATPATPATPAGSDSPFPPPAYAAAFLGLDQRTRGSWQGVYGAAGGVLFGLGAGGGDLAFLPPYVTAVTPRFSYLRGTWASALNVSDVRALQLPGAGALRSLGYLSTQAGGGAPTFAVDVTVAPGGASPRASFTVALYAADWDSRGRRGTVALLDGGSLNPLSPVQGLAGYEMGAWLVWGNVSGSFRLRVSQTRGDNFPVSALLFD